MVVSECSFCGDPDCMWIVTEVPWQDRELKETGKLELRSRKGWTSPNFRKGVELTYNWRTCSDDGPEEGISYYGLSSKDCLAPLDDLGMPDVGDTIIQYRVDDGTDRHGKKRYAWESIN